ncbi:MAG: aminopeptidase [Firmicutes bacterium]|nr:aminopeptidase [Bacillota bacterium]
MQDPRVPILAKNLVDYSVRLKPGEKVLIDCVGAITPLAPELIREAYKVGALPFVNVVDQELLRAVLLGAAREQMEAMAAFEVPRMKEMDAYIGIRANENADELSDVPPEKMDLYMKYYYQPVHFEERIPRTKWCVLRYPTPSMAQMANMSTEAFEDFYFKVCCLDYAKMSRAMDPLAALMAKTDRVRIVGPETDLHFSIKGIPVIKCDGDKNIPDGEVYTAPVRDSVNGVLAYNTEGEYNGMRFSNIRFEFKDGKIIRATANDTEKLNKLLDTDEGARHVGEFAIGVNPHIEKPMHDTLFDEKIRGSFHFTPGNAYDDAFNGNRSSIHWDLVVIQRKEYGGGEIWFDDRLVRKDGVFVVEELKGLNPENLV